MIPNEGKRIIWLVWALVAASFVAGTFTIGMFGWHLVNIRMERVQLIDRGRQLMQGNDQIIRLSSVVRSRIDDLLNLDGIYPPNKIPINEFQNFIEEQLSSNSEVSLQLILKGLEHASSKMKKIWDESITWQAQYKVVFLDLSQQRTLEKVLGIIKRLDEAITTKEGQRRIEEAILYRRWRAAQGAERSRLAQTILERQVDKETKNLGDIKTELGEITQYVDTLADEEQIDNLVDIKDNKLKASLERLRRSLASLIEIDDPFAQVGPQSLEALYVALFGKGYSIDKTHQTINVGQEGLYALQHDLLRLKQERKEIQKNIKRVSVEFDLFQDRLALLTQAYATTLATDIEEKLSRGMFLSMMIAVLTFFGLLGTAFLISRSIRRQVNTIEEARAAEHASNQTAQQLLAEQKLSAEAIAKLHRENQLILDSAGEGIYGINADGNATFVNPAGAKMLGYDVQELIGLPTHATVHHTKTDGTPYPQDECPMYATFKDGKVHHVETDVLWRKNGTSFPVEFTSMPILEVGKVAGAVVTFQDITERKQAEAAMHEAKATAENANKAKSDFLASMSHELRTPLNGILGYAQILKRDPNLAEKQKSGVDVIQRCGDHLLTLINDILDLSKIEAQKLELQPIEFQLPDCLRHVANMIQVRADQAGLTFVYETAGDLPTMVHGDEKRLRQILLNLLSNAVKFTEKGEVAFRVAYDKESGTKGTLSVKVEDTGRGIPEEKLEEIFLPFQQVGEHSPQEEGTGLGLAITKKLVALMEGTLEVTSTVGKGSTFGIKVSLSPIENWKAKPRQPERTIIGYNGARKRILVVDDKLENRAIISSLLTPLGFEVNEAIDGSEALAKAREQRPDLIVMDLVMPGMDGLEATRQIRESTDLRDIPIIASSASTFEFKRKNAIAAGCTEFLPKPIQVEELFGYLRDLLNLEWNYSSDTIEKVSTQDADQPLVPPPQEELTALLDLAKVGKIMAIRQQIASIEKLGDQYLPFVKEVRKIVKSFDMDQLVSFLVGYVENPQ